MNERVLPNSDAATYLSMRIDSISEAASRSRWIFGASIVSSCILLTAIWNELASWSSSMAVELVARTSSAASGSARQVLDDEYLKGWAQSLYITSPVIGVKIAAADVGVIGSIVLLVISLWHYSALRRENHLIHNTLREAKRWFPGGLSYSFHGIIGTQLFATVSLADQPFQRVEQTGAEASEKDPVLRLLVKLMFYMPVIAAAAVILGDLYSLMWPSPFRAGDTTSLFFQLAYNMRVWAVVRICFAVALAIVITRNTQRAARFQSSTEDLLRDAYSNVKSEETETVTGSHH